MSRVLALALTLLALPASASAGEWVAGDLHVHTTYSHDSYGGPDDTNGDATADPAELYTTGQTVMEDFAIAATRGLDYLAISDHQDIRSQSDPGYGYGGVLPIPSYENSLKGHSQMHGATRLYDRGDQSTEAVQKMVDELHADGGVFQANHPCEPLWDYDDIEPDTMEIWNLPYVYQPPFPAAGDNGCAARRWYERLDRGESPTAVGASDSHWKSTVALQGPGQPTTWIYVDELSVEGVLDGLKKGRTFISHQPPNFGGPKAFFEADGDGDDVAESMQGDTVPVDSNIWLRVQGAPGAQVRFVTDGGKASEPIAVPSHDALVKFEPEGDETWVHAQVYGEDGLEQRESLGSACSTVFNPETFGKSTYCSNRILMLAQTSALYLKQP